MRPPTAVLVVAAVAALSTSCSSDSGTQTAAPASTSAPVTTAPVPSTVPSAAPAAPRDGLGACGAVSDERASELYGRPVTVGGDGSTCRLEEADFLEQDVNVLWTVEQDTRATFADVRRQLGIRSDDAERVLLEGGVPAWQVLASEGHFVMVSMLVDGDVVFVNAGLSLLHRPFRTIPELQAIARGVAESYTT